MSAFAFRDRPSALRSEPPGNVSPSCDDVGREHRTSRSAASGLETEALDRLFEQTALDRIVIDDQNTLGHVIRNFTFTEAVQAISKLN